MNRKFEYDKSVAAWKNSQKLMRRFLIHIILLFSSDCYSQWSALQGGFDYPGRCFYYDSSSSMLIVGGNFTYADGIPAYGIAGWDGANWHPFGAGAPYGAPVYSITKFQGTLYASSVFSLPNTMDRWFYEWNGVSWDSISPSLNSAIFAFKEIGGILYIGGSFTLCGNTPFNLFGTYDGSNFNSIPIQSAWGRIGSIEEYKNNIYVGGNFFDTINLCSDVAMWDGSQFISFAGVGTTSGFDFVSSMCVYNNELYIAGSFHQIGNCSANNIVKWDGINFTPLGTGTNGTIGRIHTFNDGVYVCGGFTDAGGVSVSSVAKWDGVQWFQVCPNFTNSGIGDIIKIGSDLYLTGGFTVIDSIHCNNIVKYSLANDIEVIYDQKVYFSLDYITGNFEIHNFENEFASLMIINNFGKVVFNSRVKSEEIINLSFLNSGLYFVEICDGNRKSMHRIVIL